MNHLQIAYFLAVAKYRSFSEASRRLFVAQSAISKQILTLETKLGMKLFIRANRTVRLTPAGEVLYRELQKYNDWLQQIVDMAKQVDQGKVGILNIGILHGLDLSESEVLHFNAFSCEYPGIQLNVKRVTLQEMLQEIHVGSIDILLSFSFLIQNQTDLTVTVLKKEIDHIIVSKAHSLGKLETITPEDFEQFTLITIEPSISRLAYTNSLNYLKNLGIAPIKIMHVPAIEDIMLGVEFGLGYGVASKSSRLNGHSTICFLDMYENLEKPSLTEVIALWRTDCQNPAVQMYSDYLKKFDGGGILSRE